MSGFSVAGCLAWAVLSRTCVTGEVSLITVTTVAHCMYNEHVIQYVHVEGKPCLIATTWKKLLVGCKIFKVLVIMYNNCQWLTFRLVYWPCRENYEVEYLCDFGARPQSQNLTVKPMGVFNLLERGCATLLRYLCSSKKPPGLISVYRRMLLSKSKRTNCQYLTTPLLLSKVWPSTHFTYSVSACWSE